MIHKAQKATKGVKGRRSEGNETSSHGPESQVKGTSYHDQHQETCTQEEALDVVDSPQDESMNYSLSNKKYGFC